MCHSFKCAGTVSTNPAYLQIARIKTKNIFFRDQDVYFYYKSVFIMFLVKIVINTETIMDMVFPLNTYVIIYKLEIAPKYYATVFPLTHRTLYHKKNNIF